MKKVLFLIIGVFGYIGVFGCMSTLQLSSSQLNYQRTGLGRESPQEVANADLTLAYAEAIRKNPELLRGWYGFGFGYGWFSTDPCYYYPPGVCPVAAGTMGGDYITKGEVKEIVEEEFESVRKKHKGVDKSLEKYKRR